eukprot:6986591-Prymnesium_polylepis.1
MHAVVSTHVRIRPWRRTPNGCGVCEVCGGEWARGGAWRCVDVCVCAAKAAHGRAARVCEAVCGGAWRCVAVRGGAWICVGVEVWRCGATPRRSKVGVRLLGEMPIRIGVSVDMSGVVRRCSHAVVTAPALRHREHSRPR